MKEIALNAEVVCADDVCGTVRSVIIDPVRQEITHLVVRERHSPHNEFLVPIEWVGETAPDSIRLSCGHDKLETADPFMVTDFIEVDRASLPVSYEPASYMMWPYVTPTGRFVTVKHEQIPAGELAIRRGAHVRATDGHVGKVDEFLVDPDTKHITHLVLREGHLWGQKDVAIPVGQIARVEENTVYLKLDAQSVGQLPAIQVNRHYHSILEHLATRKSKEKGV